jgi:hypothetical protein
MGIGSGAENTKQVYNGSLKTIGTIIVNPTRDFSIDTAENKEFPAEIFILSDANASVKSGDLDIRVVRKNINIVSSDDTKQNKLTAGTNVTIDITDPLNPVINAVATSTDISGKVDKVTGKSLILDTEITRLAGVSNVDISGKQNTLVSGTNIRTVNGQSLLGATDLVISAGSSTDVISYALSAPTGNLTVGDVDTFHAPYNFTLSSYWIGVKTPPTISSLLVDVKKSGVSITSTKAGINANGYTSLTGTAPVLTTTTFVKGDVITPVISQIGSGDTGISLKIYLEVIKT